MKGGSRMDTSSAEPEPARRRSKTKAKSAPRSSANTSRPHQSRSVSSRSGPSSNAVASREASTSLVDSDDIPLSVLTKRKRRKSASAHVTASLDVAGPSGLSPLSDAPSVCDLCVIFLRNSEPSYDLWELQSVEDPSPSKRLRTDAAQEPVLLEEIDTTELAELRAAVDKLTLECEERRAQVDMREQKLQMIDGEQEACREDKQKLNEAWQYDLQLLQEVEKELAALKHLLGKGVNLRSLEGKQGECGWYKLLLVHWMTLYMTEKLVMDADNLANVADPTTSTASEVSEGMSMMPTSSSATNAVHDILKDQLVRMGPLIKAMVRGEMQERGLAPQEQWMSGAAFTGFNRPAPEAGSSLVSSHPLHRIRAYTHLSLRDRSVRLATTPMIRRPTMPQPLLTLSARRPPFVSISIRTRRPSGLRGRTAARGALLPEPCRYEVSVADQHASSCRGEMLEICVSAHSFAVIINACLSVSAAFPLYVLGLLVHFLALSLLGVLRFLVFRCCDLSTVAYTCNLSPFPYILLTE